MNYRQQIEAKHHKFSFSWQEYNLGKQNLQNYEFDKYKIIKKIGSGSFATVYLAKITSSQQKVAIKVINLKSINEVKIQKLKQIKLRLAHSQSRIMMHFSSQHIIRCYETFQSQDFKFMILQYCDGGDLAQKIEKQGKLSEDQAISMMRQIVNGLSECHSKGIIHRDLKPDNVMLHNGVCKLADFGFSKILSINTENQNQTCYNTTLGTPTTMAPQVRNFEAYGLKADIWSIGVIFFHMLFGKCPFDSKQNFNKIILRISGVLDKEEFYEGVKISDKVRKFLKQVLVVDQKERLGWKGLVGHQIFQQEIQQQQQNKGNQQQNQQLQYSAVTLRSSCFFRQVSLKIDEQKMAKLQTDIIINPNENKQQVSQQIKEQKFEDDSIKEIDNMLRSLRYCDQLINQEFQNDEKIKKDLVKRQDVQIKPCESQIIQNPIAQQQETLLYNWSRHAYLQCQKTQIIYNKIILPIETQKLLDFTQRKSIQFMYLLCTRCYNNMAPVYYVYQSNKNSQVLKQLTLMIELLYNSVQKKWNRYSYLLTQKQNQKLQIAADWTKRAILSKLFPQTYDYERRQKFMTGIQSVSDYHKLTQKVYEEVKQKISHSKNKKQENVQKQQNKISMKDYTREQQIQYTLQYFKQTKDKFLHKQSQNCKDVILHLNKLSQICNLTLEDLNNVPFKKYIEEILLKENISNMKKK